MLLRAVFRALAVGVAASLLLPLTGQEPGEPLRPATEAAIAAAVDSWVQSDQTDEQRLQAVVEVVLGEPTIGLPWLGRRLLPALAQPEQRASKGTTAIATHVVLEFLRRTEKSGMTFAGQHAPLKSLQPFAGDLLQRLLLATPDWYPDTHRRQLVPALRDLYATPPSSATLLGVIAIVENVEIEPADLRQDLACLLWQWGHKEYAQARLDELQAASGEGDAEDRIYALRQLGGLQYRLRDYGRAAGTHAALGALADRAGIRLSPTDWYWTATCHALAGNQERGLVALRRCVELQAASDVDQSIKLPRKLFEQDPEIELLRKAPEFAGLLARAFPKRAAEDR